MTTLPCLCPECLARSLEAFARLVASEPSPVRLRMAGTAMTALAEDVRMAGVQSRHRGPPLRPLPPSDAELLAQILEQNPDKVAAIAAATRMSLTALNELASGERDLPQKDWDQIWARIGVSRPGQTSATPVKPRNSTRQKAS